MPSDPACVDCHGQVAVALRGDQKSVPPLTDVSVFEVNTLVDMHSAQFPDS